MKEAEIVKEKSVTQRGPVRYQVIHRVSCAGGINWTPGLGGRVMYLEQPWTVQAGRRGAHLRGSQQVSNMELYLERNKDVGFIVFQDYACCGGNPHSINRDRLGKEADIQVRSMLFAEHIDIVSDNLRSTLANLSYVAFRGIPHPDFGCVEDEEQEEEEEEEQDESNDSDSDSDSDNESSEYDSTDDRDVAYPYLWFYHRRQKISEALDHLEDIEKENLNLFCGYIRNRMSDEWAAVDKLISRGEISAEYMRYVYVSLPTKLIVLVSYLDRFPGRLSSRCQKTAREPNYRHIWLQIGSVSPPQASPIDFRLPSRPLHGVLTANSKRTNDI